MSSRSVSIIIVANQRRLFQVPTSVPCDSFGVANSFEACFVDDLVQWLFARDAPGANSAFIDVVELWGTSVSTFNDDFLVCDYRYEHVVARLLGVAIGSKTMRVLKQERTTAARDQLRLSQIFSGAALRVTLYAFSAISPTA